MNLKATIISLVTVLVIGLTAILLYCFWPAIKGTIDNSKYYTQEELQESYDKGYNDGCKTETELIGQVKYYKDLVDEYYIQVNTLNNEITILTNNNTEKQESINLLTSQKNELAETVTSLTTTKENNEQTISTLRADIDTLTAEKQALIDDNAAKDDEIDKLNALIAEKNARIAELESSVDDKDTEIATLRLHVSDLQNQVSNLQIVKTNQETQITALTNQVSNLQSLVTQLQDTNSLHLQTIDTLNTQVKSLNTKISELKAESQNNDVTVSQLNARIDALEESITYYESFIAQLEDETQVVATYYFDNSVYNIQILSKNSCSSVVEPTSTEYVIFNGWLLEDGTSVEPATYPLSTNTKFHADVTYKYNAEFVDEDNSLDIQIVESGNYATEPTSPTKEGYEFLGWSRDGVNIVEVSTTPITAHTTFVAVWQKKHTVTYVVNGNTVDTQSVNNGAYATEYVNTDSTYIINNWLVDGYAVDIPTYKIVADTIFVADFTYSCDGTFNHTSYRLVVEDKQISKFTYSYMFYTNFVTINYNIPVSAFVYDEETDSYSLSIVTTTDMILNDIDNKSSYDNITLTIDKLYYDNIYDRWVIEGLLGETSLWRNGISPKAEGTFSGSGGDYDITATYSNGSITALTLNNEEYDISLLSTEISGKKLQLEGTAFLLFKTWDFKNPNEITVSYCPDLYVTSYTIVLTKEV